MTETYLTGRGTRALLALVCIAAIAPGDVRAYAQSPDAQASTTQDTAAITPDQMDSLVAPIALYPDPLLAQTLAASTYPLELIQLHQWLTRNPELKDQKLAKEVGKQSWDPSIQSMAVLPDVVKRLSEDIQWTTDLGNAFLAQPSDVMSAVQRLRSKAQGTGNLASSAQQVVETRVVEEKTVIVIEQADPEVIYVPSYDPMAVYGPPVYPYPPIYYPSAGYYAAGAAISFGVGVAMGAFWGGGGGWGYGAGWGHNDININRNNNFVRNSNINGVRAGNVNNRWQHNAAHRGGTPYRDNATANRFGGTARGDSLSNRQSAARSQIQQRGGNLSGSRAGAVGTSGRTPSGQGQFGGGAARSNSGSLSNRASGSASGTSRIGQRDLSGSSGNTTAFGSGSRDGSRARSEHSRGSSSMGSRSGSGMRSGGGSMRGGGGGGMRGGGGGGRRR